MKKRLLGISVCLALATQTVYSFKNNGAGSAAPAAAAAAGAAAVPPPSGVYSITDPRPFSIYFNNRQNVPAQHPAFPHLFVVSLKQTIPVTQHISSCFWGDETKTTTRQIQMLLIVGQQAGELRILGAIPAEDLVNDLRNYTHNEALVARLQAQLQNK